MINRQIWIMFFILIFLSKHSFSQENDDEDYTLAKDIEIKLHVSLCHRNCPSYSVKINGKGFVEYEGIRSVSKIGKHTKHVSQKDIASLMAFIFNTQFFTREDESTDCAKQIKLNNDKYEEMDVCIVSSHGQQIDIEVKYGNQHRTINLEHYFSMDYINIKNIIIQTAGVNKWIREKR